VCECACVETKHTHVSICTRFFLFWFRYWKSSKILKCKFAADKKAVNELWERCASICDRALRVGPTGPSEKKCEADGAPKQQSTKKKPAVSL